MIALNTPIAHMPEPQQGSAFIPWFQVHAVRFAEEKAELEAMGFALDEDKLKESSTVSFSGFLEDYPDRFLTIAFPWFYPSLAPSVVDDGKCELLCRHQKAANRAYCLFGPETKEWDANKSGAIALAETKRLLDFVLKESPGKSLDDDPFPEPFAAQPVFNAAHGMVLVPPNVADILPLDPDVPCAGLFRIKHISSENGPKHRKVAPRGVVVEVDFKGRDKPVQCPAFYANILDAHEARGIVSYIPKLDCPIYTGEDLAVVLKSNGFATGGNYPWHAVVFPDESGDRRTKRYSWLIFKREKNLSLSPVEAITYRPSEREARVPGLNILSAKRIAIFGCGSIGSKIAANLASTGISRFLLVDKDVMEPQNAVRHECGVEQFGRTKVHALALRLRSLNPDACHENCISTIEGDPFTGLNPESMRKVYDMISGCDLFINATGHSGVPRVVNEFSKQFSVPSLHVTVTNGAWSGEVIRYIPNKTPCWLCFQERFGDEGPPGEKSPEGLIFGPGCDQPTFTGTSYDVGVVAGLATAFAVDTLKVADGNASEYDGDYLLWEGRNSDGRLLQKTSSLAIPQRSHCSVCR